MSPGDVVAIDQSSGGRINHIYRGVRRGAHVLESVRGDAVNGPVTFTTFMDGDGNQLRWLRSDGFEIRYEPHDCTRTLGRCQYRQTNSNGQSEVRLRITEATSGGMSFDEYNAAGQRLFGGQLDLDERGMAGSGRIDGTQGTQTFRLLGKSY
ncbi:MAG: hypothetical protein AAFZ02_08030 [Pseudomonadota bacterium]